MSNLNFGTFQVFFTYEETILKISVKILLSLFLLFLLLLLLLLSVYFLLTLK